MVTVGAACGGGSVHSARDVWELRVGGLHLCAGAEQTQGRGRGASCRAAGLLAPRVTFQLPPVI